MNKKIVAMAGVVGLGIALGGANWLSRGAAQGSVARAG